MKNSIGVVVGRFQVPTLHVGHKYLLNHLKKNHTKRIICIGVALTPPSKENPMDFDTRKMMISKFDPQATILQVVDNRSDNIWSDNLDDLIETTYPNTKVKMYGGRDSFLKNYVGKFEKCYVEAASPISGTELRALTAFDPIDSEDFRAGIIYSTHRHPPKLFMTVDIAVTRKEDDVLKVLLGTKPGLTDLRFPGGFVDTTDDSLELAAKREVYEEADISIEGPLNLVGSYLIDDWRYKKGHDKIMTTFFHGEYTFGNLCKAGDDLASVGWYSLNKDTLSKVTPEHKKLFAALQAFLKENG